MSDYIPNPMNDPNDPRRYDKYGNSRFEPVDEAGRGPYILLGILVAIGLIGGLLYFNGTPRDQNQQAQAPAATERPMTTPSPATPTPAKPAPGAATTAPSDTQKQ